MTSSAHICAAVAVSALALPLAGCGDDDVGDPIPRAKASRLTTQLDAVRDHVDNEACDDARTAVNQALATVDTLDEDGVGQDVQDALGDGVGNLGSLVSQQCEEPVETVPETTPDPTITDTAPEPTTPPPTTPPPTTPPTTPAPTTPEPEPDEDDGSGQFDPDAEIPPGQRKKLEERD